MRADFEGAKAEHDALERKSKETGDALRKFPRSAIGLVSNAVRTSPEYVAAKKASDVAFAQLQSFNKVYVKAFAKELKAERDAKIKRLQKKD